MEKTVKKLSKPARAFREIGSNCLCAGLRRAATQFGDVFAEAGEHLRAFQCDVAPAENDQRFGELFQFEGRIVGQVPCFVQSRDRRNVRGGAGHDDDAVGSQAASVDLNGMRIQKTRAAPHDFHLRQIGYYVQVLGLTLFLDELSLLFDHGSEIAEAPGRFDAINM